LVVKISTKFGCLPVAVPSATIEVETSRFRSKKPLRSPAPVFYEGTTLVGYQQPYGINLHANAGYQVQQKSVGRRAHVDCTVKYIGNSLWTISFLPMCDGMYIISITANGKILLTHKLNIDI